MSSWGTLATRRPCSAQSCISASSTWSSCRYMPCPRPWKSVSKCLFHILPYPAWKNRFCLSFSLMSRDLDPTSVMPGCAWSLTTMMQRRADPQARMASELEGFHPADRWIGEAFTGCEALCYAFSTKIGQIFHILIDIYEINYTVDVFQVHVRTVREAA